VAAAVVVAALSGDISVLPDGAVRMKLRGVCTCRRAPAGDGV
jgi:hypothetical protein